jgi:hypothetical protein
MSCLLVTAVNDGADHVKPIEQQKAINEAAKLFISII